MAIDKDKSLVHESEFDLDSAFVSHHVLESSCDHISFYIGNKRCQSFLDENYHVSGLQTHWLQHDVIWSKTLLNHRIHELFWWTEYWADNSTEGFLGADDENVVMDDIRVKQVIQVYLVWGSPG